MGTISKTIDAARPGASSIRPDRRVSGPQLLSVSLGLVLRWMDRARQRRALQALDDRLLKDIGVTRADVELETAKWFWQI